MRGATGLRYAADLTVSEPAPCFLKPRSWFNLTIAMLPTAHSIRNSPRGTTNHRSRSFNASGPELANTGVAVIDAIIPAINPAQATLELMKALREWD
jgi:hypothetical protein